jgi:hypothetical protein
MLKKLLPLLSLPALLAGCASQFTNLTPQQQTRNANHLYPVEVAFTSHQQSLRWDSIQPSVVIGTNFYTMRPTPLMKNRWETLVPVPADTTVTHYRYKFDFQYNAIPDRPSDSLLSPDYTLQILDK